EEPLLEPHLPLAAALRADGRRRSGCRTRPLAGVAVFLTRNLNRGFGAGRGFLESDLEIVAEIGAALCAPTPPAAPEHIPEPEDVAEIAEQIFEAAEGRRVETGAAGGADARVAEPVVQPSFLLVREERIGFRGLLELLLGPVVPG